jgi:multiple sugar transport system ATP-binding protein
MPNLSMLKVEALRVRLGAAEVLKGIDLEIQKGEFVVLVGPSGCGKSTLLNVIAGLERSAVGRILIDGRDVTGVAPKDRDIAMVFQSYALYPAMTVRGNITFGMQCRGVPKAEQRTAVARVAKLLQIGQLLERKPSELSGGQRQRVAMGRALVRDPVLFLFDEPLSNLDAKLRVEMRMEIKRLHKRLGTTIVYVTHDQIEAMTLATRIAVMHGGEILQFDDPQTIYDRPSNLFVAGFMGSPPMNVVPVRLEAEDGKLVAVAGEASTGRDGGQPMVRMTLPHGFDNLNLQTWLGKTVLLGIRPECIALGGNAALRITAQVEMIEPTGAEILAVLNFAGTQIVARMDVESRPLVGAPAEFSFDLRKACLFDPDTQRRII